MKPIQMTFCVLALTNLAGLLPARPALAQWSTNPTANTPVCTLPTRPSNVGIVTDGMGGAIIGWVDFDLNTGEYDIRAQRLSAAGTIQWGAAGLPVCTASDVQSQLRMVSDGAGGAFLVWMDRRTGINNIYAQRLDASGAALWAPGGVPVYASDQQQTFGVVTADGTGGMIVSWQDSRVAGINSPYAQRLNADGVPQWASEGVLLGAGTSENIEPLGDGAGGAFFVWHKYVSGQFDIQAQRVLPGGSVAWGAGVTVCNQAGNQFRPKPVADGAGGVILAWEDYRNTSYSLVHAQRLNGAGTAQWAANGVATAPNTLDQRDPRLIGDGSGGAYVVWSYMTGYGIYAQYIGSGGTRQWATDGSQIAWAAGNSWQPSIVTDGAGGAIIGWSDDRAGAYGFDVFAQRVNSAGVVQWTTQGISVCTSSGSQLPTYLLADGSGGAIALWIDGRNSALTDNDLYAQRISPTGNLGSALGVGDGPSASGLTLAQNHPNPSRGATTIEWGMPERGPVSLEVFDLSGRRVATLASGEVDAGPHARRLDTTDLASGVYYYSLRAGRVSLTRRMVLIR